MTGQPRKIEKLITSSIPSLVGTRIEAQHELMIRRVLDGVVHPDPVTYALLFNFVRLAEQTLVVYQGATNDFMEMLRGSNSEYPYRYLLLTGEFETCLMFANRAGRLWEELFERLHDQPVMAMPQPSLDTLRLLRNRIEHFEEDILKGKTLGGEPLLLVIDKDDLFLGEQSITYTDLATLIRDMYDQAVQLARWVPPQPPTPAAPSV